MAGRLPGEASSPEQGEAARSAGGGETGLAAPTAPATTGSMKSKPPAWSPPPAFEETLGFPLETIAAKPLDDVAADEVVSTTHTNPAFVGHDDDLEDDGDEETAGGAW